MKNSTAKCFWFNISIPGRDIQNCSSNFVLKGNYVCSDFLSLEGPCVTNKHHRQTSIRIWDFGIPFRNCVLLAKQAVNIFGYNFQRRDFLP